MQWWEQRGRCGECARNLFNPENDSQPEMGTGLAQTPIRGVRSEVREELSLILKKKELAVIPMVEVV